MIVKTEQKYSAGIDDHQSGGRGSGIQQEGLKKYIRGGTYIRVRRENIQI